MVICRFGIILSNGSHVGDIIQHIGAVELSRYAAEGVLTPSEVQPYKLQICGNRILRLSQSGKIFTELFKHFKHIDLLLWFYGITRFKGKRQRERKKEPQSNL